MTENLRPNLYNSTQPAAGLKTIYSVKKNEYERIKSTEVQTILKFIKNGNE